MDNKEFNEFMSNLVRVANEQTDKHKDALKSIMHPACHEQIDKVFDELKIREDEFHVNI